MKKFLLSCFLMFASACAMAQLSDADTAYRKQINAFIDEWHDDAANARLAYFDKIAPHGIYIGTDKTELWNRDQFKAWAQRFFERKSAWSFKAVKRNVYMSADKKFIWFDELLDTQMGPCQASGVIRKTDKGFEIEHYQLSIAVPNEVADKVTKLVKENDSKPMPKKD
ncbi:MAG: nuclear transport factor 2 family protein [Massilia sp.]